MLQISERIILCIIYGQIKETSIQKSRHNHELYNVHNEPDSEKVIKAKQLKWLGHLFKTQVQNLHRK
jgi:hypothetical protein